MVAAQSWKERKAGAEIEKLSWHVSLPFYGFEMSETEIEHLAATAIAVAHVRWQWISSWVIAERLKMSAVSSAAA